MLTRGQRQIIEEVAGDLEADAGPPPADYETCLREMKRAVRRLRTVLIYDEAKEEPAA